MGILHGWFNRSHAPSISQEQGSDVAEPTDGKVGTSPEREWEDTQRKLRDTLSLLQGNARDLTRSVRDFQDRYIDDCELHCVRCLIDVHRHLDGLRCSHGQFAADSDDQRYVRLIESLAVLARQVERDLASFGVVMYTTEPGAPYDPGIHIADVTDTVSPGAVVVSSLRPGFRSERLGERLMDDRELVHVGRANAGTVRKEDE